jgi:hypothetical protein
MYLTLGEVLVLFVFCAAGLYFFSAIRVRELAINAVAQASKRDDFQLLDQTVHIQRMSLSRDDSGRWRIWRQYRFDYSLDGVERRQGHVMMLAKQVQAVVVSVREPTVH